MAVSCYWRGLRVWASKFLFPLKIDPFFAHLYYYLKLTLQKEVKENIKPPHPYSPEATIDDTSLAFLPEIFCACTNIHIYTFLNTKGIDCTIYTFLQLSILFKMTQVMSILE